MKRFAAVALAALMLLSVFAASASAADTVEIRSSVYTETDLDEGITITSDDFAGFYYDIDDDLTSETISILSAKVDGRTIDDDGLEYVCSIVNTTYEYDLDDWAGAEYPIIGFFAEQFVPLVAEGDELWESNPDKLAKLLIDDDEKYTLRTGEKLDLGSGYTLEAKQVDVEGDKVWLEFGKDGEYIDDEIIDVSTASESTSWIVDLDDVEDEDDVVVLRVHVNQVFQGAVDSIAQIEGLWLIDYENAFTIESDDEFGEFEVQEINDGTDGENLGNLTLRNDATVTLTKDSVEDLGDGLAFNVADDNAIRFYLMKEFTEPGTYEVRGSIATGDAEWNFANFAGFFYDLDDDVASESLTISAGLTDTDRLIDDDELTYISEVTSVNYEYTADPEWNKSVEYPVIGFFAEEYVPLRSLGDELWESNPDKLAKLLVDSDDKYTLRTGEKLDLGAGYTLEAKQVDVDGEKVWLEFGKDGEFVDDEIIEVATDKTWEVDLDDVQDEDDVVVLRVHVNQVFQGAVDSIAQIEGLWLIDYENAFTIESDDEFGDLEVQEINDGIDADNLGNLTLRNDATITLTKDSEQDIAEDMMFKVADSSELRFYPFVERTIEGDEDEVPPVETEPTETEPVDEINVTEPVVEDNVTEPVVTPDADVTEEPEDTETPEEPEDTPGFGFVFGLAGLLAVVYLVRRN